jgi:hypothetical protein
MIFRLHVLITLLIFFSSGLFSTAYATGGNIKGKVTETLDASGYTYVQIDTGIEKIWGAAPTTAISVGDEIEFSTDMPMRDYKSKSLNRSFPVVYFAPRFISSTNNSSSGTPAISANTISQKPAAALKTMAKAKDGYTIAEIYNDKISLAGKTIRVRGQVTKFSANVMNKNWLHIMDNSGENDLTITSVNTAAVGDVVVISGKLVLDKDFGAGYFYPLIMEQALITKE